MDEKTETKIVEKQDTDSSESDNIINSTSGAENIPSSRRAYNGMTMSFTGALAQELKISLEKKEISASDILGDD